MVSSRSIPATAANSVSLSFSGSEGTYFRTPSVPIKGHVTSLALLSRFELGDEALGVSGANEHALPGCQHNEHGLTNEGQLDRLRRRDVIEQHDADTPDPVPDDESIFRQVVAAVREEQNIANDRKPEDDRRWGASGEACDQRRGAERQRDYV